MRRRATDSGGISAEVWSSAVSITSEFLRETKGFLLVRPVAKQGNCGAVVLVTGMSPAALMAVRIRKIFAQRDICSQTCSSIFAVCFVSLRPEIWNDVVNDFETRGLLN